MAYLGSTPNYGFLEGQTVTFNGSTTQVTLNRAISTPDAIDVFIDNVHQEPDVAYTVDAGGGSITFTGTPVNGAVCYIRFHGQKFDTAQASQVIDSDGDTHVKVEASSDSDTVVVTAGGTVAITANSSGVTIPNLTVTGTTTSVNSTNLNIGDNQITLNSDVTGTPSENAGLIVNRGNASDVSFLWNETSDYWIVNEPLVSATRINAIVSGNTPSLDGDNIGLFQNSASSQNAIVSIISNSSNYSQLNFGDENDENAGYLRYNNSSDLFTLNSPITISGNTTVNGSIITNTGFSVGNTAILGQEIDVSSGDFTLDVAGKIKLSADDTGTFYFQDSDTIYGVFEKSSSDWVIRAGESDGDIIFKGVDSSTAITALQLDMSDAGTAVFNHDIKLADAQMVRFGSSQDSDIAHYSDNQLAFRNTTGSMTFYTGGTPTERLRLDSVGSLGLGTSAPFNSRAGSLTISNQAPTLYLEDTNSTGSDVGQILYSNGDLFYDTGSRNGTGTSGSTTHFTITNSGNVGIGMTPNTNYSRELNIKGSSTNSRIKLTNTTTGSANTDGFDILTDGNGAYVWNRENDILAFATNNDEKMRINSSGNVGIGVSNPNGKLVVNEPINNAHTTQIKILNSAGWSSSVGFLKSLGWSDGQNVAGIGAEFDGNKVNMHFHSFYNGGYKTETTKLMTILGNGNVGIGTASPSYGIHLTGSGNNSYIRTVRSGGQTGTFGSDNGGTFVEAVGSTPLTFYTNASERMRITSAGLVGIGTTSPTVSLHVSGSIMAEASSNAWAYFKNPSKTYLVGVRGSSGNALSFYDLTADVERMRILSSGQVLCNATSSLGNGTLHINAGSNVSSLVVRANATNGSFALLQKNNGDTIGSIDHTASVTRYLTSSDYRLKENITYDFDATSRLKQLKPCRFNFIADPNTTIDGFIAHEVTAVPEAISGEKDAVDADGKIDPQGIDQSKLVPLLVKTIQELEARITTLENA